MVQRYKNPNRNVPRQRAPYVPEYKRHGVRPIPIDENGRVMEEDLDDLDGSAPFQGGPALNVGFHDTAAFHVDGVEADESEEEQEVQPPPRQQQQRSKRKQIAPGEYIILVNGQVVASGDEDAIKSAITSLIYNQSLNPDDMVVLRRMEVGFGVTLG